MYGRGNVVMTWHTITPIGENVYRISEPIGAIEPRVGVKTVNMYLVIGSERAALIDSGMGVGDIMTEIGKITSLPCMVLNTHYHWDHVGANAHFTERAIHELEVSLVSKKQNVGSIRKAMMSPTAHAILPASFDPKKYQIAPKPATCSLNDNDLLDLGGRALRVFHTPGHSPGHVTYLDEESNMLFTGDTAYRGPVYACFEGSDPAAFVESVKRLASLPNVKTICPGHNDPITEKDWLGRLAECAEVAVSGKVSGKRHDGFIIGQEYAFDTFSIWLPR
jgi:glyoxylase-like metal-dependent hydrolase (beta-lactamase superfamily II)